MDDTDVKILKRLLNDARSSYRKIAEEIGGISYHSACKDGKSWKEKE